MELGGEERRSLERRREVEKRRDNMIWEQRRGGEVWIRVEAKGGKVRGFERWGDKRRGKG